MRCQAWLRAPGDASPFSSRVFLFMTCFLFVCLFPSISSCFPSSVLPLFAIFPFPFPPFPLYFYIPLFLHCFSPLVLRSFLPSSFFSFSFSSSRCFLLPSWLPLFLSLSPLLFFLFPLLFFLFPLLFFPFPSALLCPPSAFLQSFSFRFFLSVTRNPWSRDAYDEWLRRLDRTRRIARRRRSEALSTGRRTDLFLLPRVCCRGASTLCRGLAAFPDVAGNTRTNPRPVSTRACGAAVGGLGAKQRRANDGLLGPLHDLSIRALWDKGVRARVGGGLDEGRG